MTHDATNPVSVAAAVLGRLGGMAGRGKPKNSATKIAAATAAEYGRRSGAARRAKSAANKDKDNAETKGQ